MITNEVFSHFKEVVGEFTVARRVWLRSSGIPTGQTYRQHVADSQRFFLSVLRATMQKNDPGAFGLRNSCFDGSALTLTPQQKVGLRRYFVDIIASRAVQIYAGANHG